MKRRSPAVAGLQTTGLGGEVDTPEGTTIYLVQWRRQHWQRAHAEWPGRRLFVRRHAALKLARARAEAGAEVRVTRAGLGEWRGVEL